MSTNNIGFYEDLTKIIFQLSSNFIKYTPFLLLRSDLDQVGQCLQTPDCASKQTGLSLS